MVKVCFETFRGITGSRCPTQTQLMMSRVKCYSELFLIIKSSYLSIRRVNSLVDFNKYTNNLVIIFTNETKL